MTPLEVGDKIRILEDRHNEARVFKGDVLGVVEDSGSYFKTEAPRITNFEATWAFDYEDEGTGWERYKEAGA